MIVATTRIKVAPGNRSELFQTILPLMGSVRSEQGCLSSRLYLDVGDQNSSILIEEWETQADWDKHLRSNDCAILMGAMSVLCSPLNVEFKLLMYVAGIEAVTTARAARD